MSTQLHGAVGVVEEFQKYRTIPQIRELMARCVCVCACCMTVLLYVGCMCYMYMCYMCMCYMYMYVYMYVYMCMCTCVLFPYRLQSIQVDLGQQIKVDFERAFSTKGTPVTSIS